MSLFRVIVWSMIFVSTSQGLLWAGRPLDLHPHHSHCCRWDDAMTSDPKTGETWLDDAKRICVLHRMLLWVELPSCLCARFRVLEKHQTRPWPTTRCMRCQTHMSWRTRSTQWRQKLRDEEHHLIWSWTIGKSLAHVGIDFVLFKLEMLLIMLIWFRIWS